MDTNEARELVESLSQALQVPTERLIEFYAAQVPATLVAPIACLCVATVFSC